MIGGLFADPAQTYPSIFPATSIFARFPYLLPNLICAGMLLMSILLGYFLLEETHPDMQPRVLLPNDTFLSENTPLMETSDAMKRPAVDLRRDENYGTIPRGVSPSRAEKLPPPPPTIFTKPILAVILSLAIFTYHSMTFDHLLPIFFEDARATTSSSSTFAAALAMTGPFASPGGLGLSLQAVGVIMAVQGVIALFMQAVVFPVAAERFGVHRLFLFVTVMHPVVYALVPMLLYVPEGMLYPAIYFCLAVRNFFSILLYPLLLILIKEATPGSAVLGKVNGLAASAGAACRMVAPPVAGYLYSVGRKMDCTALAWYGSVVVAVVGAVQCFSVKRTRARQGGC